jgi:hypothetical protein
VKLYIANTTQQSMDLWYRTLEQRALRMQRIEIGSQIAISGELSTPDIEYIVQQHRPYGLVCVDEIDRTKPFIGMCYSIDAPIQIDKIQRALEHNEKVLVERGRQIRTEAAVSLHQNLEQQQNPNFTLNATSTTFVEEQTKSNPNPQWAEGVKVDTKYPRNRAPSKPKRVQVADV